MNIWKCPVSIQQHSSEEQEKPYFMKFEIVIEIKVLYWGGRLRGIYRNFTKFVLIFPATYLYMCCHKIIIITFMYAIKFTNVKLDRISLRNDYFQLPEHVFPSPWYPGRHLQLKPVIVFVHMAFESQSWIPYKHSSISEINCLIFTV